MDRYSYSGSDHDRPRNQRRADRDSAAPQPIDSMGTTPRRQDPEPEPADYNADDRSTFRIIYDFLTGRTFRAILGLVCIVLAAYLVLAAIQFFAKGAKDESLIAAHTVGEIVRDGHVIQNAGGPIGAKISHLLFINSFGWGSVFLIAYLAIIGLALFKAVTVKFWSLSFKTLLTTVATSMVLGLIFINSHSVIPPGGYFGRYSNIFLIQNIGIVGAVAVSSFLVGTLIIIYFNQITAFVAKSRERLEIIKAKRELEMARKNSVKEQVDEAMADITDDEAPEQPEQTEYGPEPVEFGPAVQDDEPGIGEEPADDEDAPKPRRRTRRAAAEGPAFQVVETEEIEQGMNENEAYRVQGPYDPKAELSRYRMPGLDLLKDRPRKANCVDFEEQEANKERITDVLREYGIEIEKIEATVGPTVTLYKIVPAEGVRIAKIKRLEDDIAMKLAALGIRIIAPIPGESNIGIEVPNKDPQTVSIRSILGSKAFQESKAELPLAMGATINNEVYITDLAKMPHLLVAGATGQGKSVGLNTIIASLLYKRHPSELKFVLIDPKMVEFSLYSRIEQHYLAKLPDEEEAVVTDMNKVVNTLNSLCIEMGNRYALLKDAGCRAISEYNEMFIHRKLNPEKGHRFMPYIIMIVDEFADLMMTSGKLTEKPIARIAQKARAVGMHLIIATQRPSTDVITGMIKANFPGRMAFMVRQRVDSMTILDCSGASQLIGKGDMLISASGGQLERVQCAFIDTQEVTNICNFINNQIGFPTAYILPEPPVEGAAAESSAGNLSERDNLFDEVARYIATSPTASTSNIQRKYAIGYNRAGKIMDQLEAAGVVGPSQGGRPRQVLMSPEEIEMLLGN